MTDDTTREVLRSAIRTLFPVGPTRRRWLAWLIAYRKRNPATLVGRLTRSGSRIRRMPLDLTASELETAARACRAMAYQEGERAKAMENPTMRPLIDAAARRYAALAEKFETARKRA